MERMGDRDEKRGVRGRGRGKRAFFGVVAALLALAAGGVNALFGGGGGLIILPALSAFGVKEEKKRHASAVALMLPLSLLSALVYTARGLGDFSLACKVGAGAIVGGLIGSLLLKKVPRGLLTFLFGGVMIYAGIRYLR